MSDAWLEGVLERLRRDGAVVVASAQVDDVDEWRRAVRGACRAAGLRIRTGVTANGAVWVEHRDHVVTDAEMDAAARAVDNYLSGKPARPFQVFVQEEQRKRFTVVDGDTGEESTAAPSAPGEVDQLVIEYSSRQYAFKVDDDRWLRQWYASIGLTDDNGEVTENVGHVLAYTVAYDEMTDPINTLDTETADLGHVASAVFDLGTGEIDPGLDERIEPFGHGMLIIDSVRLEPSWRGHGLGPLLAGMVIEHLGESVRFVALQPAPTEHRDAAGNVVDRVANSERDVAVEKLGKLWTQLGFAHFKDNVWVLDLALKTFSERMRTLRSQLGLA